MKTFKNATLLLVILLTLTVCPAMASATTETAVITEPFDFFMGNLCDDELVHVSGTHRFHYRITMDASGGFHYEAHDRWVGSGYGLSTGNQYRYMKTTSIIRNQHPESYPYTFTTIDYLRFVAQGPYPNLMMIMTRHFTVNANGELTADFWESSLECR